ncbi:MAG: glutamate formimidoyltransferase [SAR324 cluster bacterium]|uniref:glutamate formimidoyltransferase n=1 Tax=SAR324 cluster bacterium TaxID=2024889 RepID=A0A2A4T2D3_9DELT|nr:MAG: glutamate formimidoyltransferase [SAR324 cluster bacterium]
MSQWIECVPNFSEGCDEQVLNEIARVIRAIPEVYLLEVDPGAGAHRTVFTFAGKKNAMAEAAFQAIRVASEKIDMTQHRGVHPRIGAIDVCPFIPLEGSTIDDCIELACQVGHRIGTELGLPGYFYGAAASRLERKNLTSCRSGQYEGISQKLKNPDWLPDFGPAVFHAKSGMTIVGAREFLIAYNLNLNTDSVSIAKKIAAKVRSQGKLPSANRLPALKAIGWDIPEYGIAQVSTNVISFPQNSLFDVWLAVSKEAEKLGVQVTGSELVGLVPLKALLDAGQSFAKQQEQEAVETEFELIALATTSLGLGELRPFDPQKKILDYVLNQAIATSL